MSDAHFDGLRDAGLYPPKGWGFKSPEEKREDLLRRLEDQNRPPWVDEMAKRYGVLS